ncbi:hypothetical protein K440DRAFT_662444 [Wilcoxina mikolae CBS 423.85]|nr:hypothetical protein K440DRAFT_662444 [Wilcoxina mikolae CBS 423.85]
MALDTLSSDKITWMVAGVGTALAIYTTYWQLENFKKRTATKPSSTRSVGVEQSTEDAIKLSTLSALARGVNPELRSAALKILCERGLKEEALSAILDKAELPDLASNFMALRVLGLLVQNVSARRLIQPRIFRALIGILRRSSTPAAERNSNAVRCQREAIGLLSRFISLGDECQRLAVDAGLIKWLKESRVAGYNNLYAAMFDNNNDPIDQNIYELLSQLCGRGPMGRNNLEELGLVRNLRGSPSSSRPFELEHDDWIEVEVEEDEPQDGRSQPQREQAQGATAEVPDAPVVFVLPVEPEVHVSILGVQGAQADTHARLPPIPATL